MAQQAIIQEHVQDPAFAQAVEAQFEALHARLDALDRRVDCGWRKSA
jgi:hypothetical protein